MSQGETSPAPQHEIQTWEDDTCSHLLPYWREMFKSQSISANYNNEMTPPFGAVHTKSVELIFHLCSSLKQPLPVYFLTVDVFDNFLANHISNLWRIIGRHDLGDFHSSWGLITQHVKEQLLLRVLSSMQLASKIIYSPHQLTAVEVKDFLEICKQKYDLKSIITSEFRVFKTLNFRLPTCSPLECLEMLILQCCLAEHHTQLHQVAVDVLKFCYLQEGLVKKLRDDDHPSMLSACSLLVSSHLQRLGNKKPLRRSVSHATSISEHTLKSRTKSILNDILVDLTST